MVGLLVMLVAVLVVTVLARLGRLAAPVAFGAATVFVLGAVAAELTDNVVDHDGLARVDPTELNWMIAHRNGVLTPMAVAISNAGDTVPMAGVAILACAVLAWRRRWAPMVLVAAATAGAGILVTGLKTLVGRARPPVVDHLVAESNQSFPSGHSLGSSVVLGVLAAVIMLYTRRRVVRVMAVVLAGLAVVAVGLSRLYLGVHWPTDILGGWVIGALWLVTCLTVYTRFHRAVPGPPTAISTPHPSEVPHGRGGVG